MKEKINNRLQIAARHAIAENKDPALLWEELCTVVVDTLDEADLHGLETPGEFCRNVCQALDDAVMHACEESIWERVELAIQETVEKEL
jgi:hypothetical protein